MTREEEELLAKVTSAHRPRGADGSLRPHPAWHDLPEHLRVLAHQETEALRRMEAAADPGGLSTTVKAVLARILAAKPSP